MTLDGIGLHLVDTPEARERFLSWLGQRRPVLGVDTETGGLEWWHQELRMVQFGDARDGWAIPVDYLGISVHDLLVTYDGPMVAHNTKFDTHFLARADVVRQDNPYPIAEDSVVSAALAGAADPVTGSLRLKDLSVRFIDPRAADFEKALSALSRKHRTPWWDFPVRLPVFWQYAALDPVLTAILYEEFHGALNEKELRLYDVERDVWQLCYEAEERGVAVDLQYVRNKRSELRVQRDELDFKWGNVNLDAGQQVADWLIKDGVKLWAKTPTGKWDTSKAILSSIDHPLAADVLEAKHLTKLVSTYFDPIIRMEDDGRIHTTLNTIRAKNGRMSCSEPNLQNQPRGVLVRDAFVSSPGHTLVLADFSQIEYRIFAHFSGEPAMLEAFRAGKDLHAETARIVLGHDPSKQERSTAKNANFAKIYMAGLEKFAATAHIDLATASSFMEAYDERFPGVRPFSYRLINDAKELGYVETAGGRKIAAEEGREYACVNYKVSGTAADVFKVALQNIRASDVGQYFVLPVHDEAIFDVPDDLVDDVVAALPGLMEVPDVFDVPLTIDIETTKRWGDKYREDDDPAFEEDDDAL